MARENFVALLDENSERGLLRLSHARELLEDDPRWRVRPVLCESGLRFRSQTVLGPCVPHAWRQLLPCGKLGSMVQGSGHIHP